jgi:hypothetical protein
MTKMQNKVLGTSKVSTPAGHEIGEFPPTTAPNPSQHGMNAPTVPPSHVRPPSQADYKPGGRNE